MRLGLALALLMLPVPAVAAGSQPASLMPGVERPERARQNYILKCQGCHGPEAQGNRSNTPPMAGMVARFLAVPGGREFLGRVPGVATAAVSDAELAELLNWTLYRFDAAHVPPGFTPYGTTEIGKLRKTPLRTETASLRQTLVRAMKTKQATGK
jgi:mono/diheme cytochrome c family protein